MAGGARLAAPGEFTLRAFLNKSICAGGGGRRPHRRGDAGAGALARSTGRHVEPRLAAIGEALFDLRVRLPADFPDEGYHLSSLARSPRASGGRKSSRSSAPAAREGCRVALAGALNVGKSLLFMPSSAAAGRS
jgi:tRNA U34 5-carboxymethylaminomethyl modifying GTPase MnmE/TrmE